MLVGVLKTRVKNDDINSPPRCDFFETYVSCCRTLRHENDLLCEVTWIYTSLFPRIVFLSWIKSCLWELLLRCTLVKFQVRYTLQTAARPYRLTKNTVLQSHNGQGINLLIESEVKRIVPAISTVYFFTSLMCLISEKLSFLLKFFSWNEQRNLAKEPSILVLWQWQFWHVKFVGDVLHHRYKW